MKTFVLVAYILAIASTAYSFNQQRLKQFHENLEKCSEDAGLTKEDALTNSGQIGTVMTCVGHKEGTVDKDGSINKEQVLIAIKDVISDPENESKAEQIFLDCYNKIGEGESDRTMKIIECSKPAILLID